MSLTLRARLLDVGRLLRDGRKAEAVDALTTAMRELPKWFDGHLRLGQLLLDLDRPEEAVASLETAARLNAARADVHFFLGRALSRTRRWGDAEPPFRRAIQLAPTSVRAVQELIFILIKQNRADDLALLALRVMAIMPGHLRGHFYMGISFRSRGRFDCAVMSFRRALSIAPESREATIMLSRSLANGGCLADGVAVLRAGSARHPTLARMADWMALTVQASDFAKILES